MIADPRPDLGDGALFARLLAAAHRLDGDDPAGAYGVLHGLRCLGARVGTDFGRPRLLPGEIPADEYGEYRRRYLLPLGDRLRALLAGVGVPRAGDVSQEARA